MNAFPVHQASQKARVAKPYANNTTTAMWWYRKKRKEEKTAPLGVRFTRSLVIYQAAQNMWCYTTRKLQHRHCKSIPWKERSQGRTSSPQCQKPAVKTGLPHSCGSGSPSGGPPQGQPAQPQLPLSPRVLPSLRCQIHHVSKASSDHYAQAASHCLFGCCHTVQTISAALNSGWQALAQRPGAAQSGFTDQPCTHAERQLIASSFTFGDERKH